MAEERGNLWQRFGFVEPLKKFIDAKEKGITWSDSDVEAFIAIDPVHGPVVENARKAAKVAAIGSAVGALHLGGTALRYSKSPHGILALSTAYQINFNFYLLNIYLP
ncbi:hypothetical protein MKW94_003922 [Papaver nudicaule]|uniref:Uncharacterized protein n=1 Tax=Papaver nudicaule TaxID=74823 RepID=A0AA41VLA2_PAPNU|nr:hypothetical protein [Papaver nudicaule]